VAELALTLAEPCNRARTLLLTIPRARARTPMRPNTEFAVNVRLTTVGVAFMDLDVGSLCGLAARIRFDRDLTPAPSKPTTTWSIALTPTSPFTELSVDAKLRARLSVTSCGFCRIFRQTRGATTLRRSLDDTGTVPLAATTLASACAPMVPLAPGTVDACSTIMAWSHAGLGHAEVTLTSHTAHDVAVLLALALAAIGAAFRPRRPMGEMTNLCVILAVVHFFKTAFARHATVGSVLNDLALARFFGTLAVLGMSAPMRPLAEDTIPCARWGFVVARLQAASFALDKDTLAGFAAFVVRASNGSLA